MNDSISRQAAIDEFSCCELTPDGGIDANYAIDFLKQLPSTQPEVTEEAVKEYCRKRSLCVVDSELLKKYASKRPERKKGTWAPHRELCREYIGTVLVNVTYDFWFCDICGYQVKNGQPTYNFCPNCGADMRWDVY
jgi:rubrerythrin